MLKRNPLREILLRENAFIPGRLRRAISDVAFRRLDRKLQQDPGTSFQPQVPPLEMIFPLPDGIVPRSQTLLFAAGDLHYLQRFAYSLAKSVAAHAPDMPIHLHQIGGARPSLGSGMTILQELRQKYPDLQLSWSWEAALVEEMDAFERGRYCQTIRFFRIAEIMSAWAGNVLAVDIDSILRRSPAEVLASLSRKADVAFHQRPNDPCEGRRVLAGCVWFGNCDSARKLLADASRQMLLHVQHGFFTEKLDQRCLYLTARNMTETLRIANFPAGFFGWNEDDDPTIFTAKGARKKVLNTKIEP